MPKGGVIRPAAVAGRFYPGEPERLRATVTQFLDEARASVAAPKALIAPHAGYVYSGWVAGGAFATLRGATGIDRVVLIGPAHYVSLRGIAVPTAEAFETPLGRVPVDRAALGEISDLDPVTRADAPHAPEHALEVELPFLQTVLGDFALVPLLIGYARPEEVADVLSRLWGGSETRIVVSSDLSHFLSYEDARRMDEATAETIERGDWSKLRSEHACGHVAVAGLLIEAARQGLAARRLALMNSGDTAGPKSSVVGYGAWAFTERDASQGRTVSGV